MKALIGLVTLTGLLFGVFILPTLNQKAALDRLERWRGEVGFAVFYDYQKRPEPVGYSHWDLDAELPGPEFLHRWLGEDAFRTPIDMGILRGGSDNLQFYKDLNRIQTWEEISFGTWLDDAMMAEITGQPKLKVLRADESNMTDAGCEAIGKLTSLRELHVDQNRFTDKGLASLGKLRNLEQLFISQCQFRGSGFEQFENPRSLKRLDIARSELSDESGKWIGRFRNLESLYLYRTKLSDQWLKNVGGLPNVTLFNLAGSQISGEGFRDWPVSMTEVGISIDATHVDNKGWRLIKQKFPNSEITGRGSGMTREILTEIVSQSELSRLDVSDMQLEDEDYKLIAGCAELKSLTLNGNAISNEQLKFVLGLKKLDVLSVRRCPNLDDQAFETYRQLSVRELNVSEKQYSSEVIRDFEKEYGYRQVENDSGIIFTAW